MKYLPFILGAAIIGVLALGSFTANRNLGGVPSNVSSSTNINQLYGEVNNLVDYLRSSTSSLGQISTLSSTTGNLIVGSSSSWIAKTVGSNNLYLMASSTAQGGVSWESVVLPGDITFNTASGTSATSALSAFSGNFQELRVASSTFSSTVVINGSVQGDLTVTGAIQGNTLNVTSTSVFGSTLQGTAGIFSGLGSFNTLNVTSTAAFTGITFTNATGTGNLQVATFNSTGLSTVNSLNVTNGNEYRRKSANISIVNPDPTVHSTGTITIYFPVAATINSVACYSRPSGSSTIQMDLRVSSTPATVGTNILTVFECTSTRAASTTIASASITADSLLNIKIGGVSGSPSSTIISIDFTNND